MKPKEAREVWQQGDDQPLLPEFIFQILIILRKEHRCGPAPQRWINSIHAPNPQGTLCFFRLNPGAHAALENIKR